MITIEFVFLLNIERVAPSALRGIYVTIVPNLPGGVVTPTGRAPIPLRGEFYLTLGGDDCLMTGNLAELLDFGMMKAGCTMSMFSRRHHRA
jgi:hypothetical protein